MFGNKLENKKEMIRLELEAAQKISELKMEFLKYTLEVEKVKHQMKMEEQENYREINTSLNDQRHKNVMEEEAYRANRRR